jgi:hypothetical protein
MTAYDTPQFQVTAMKKAMDVMRKMEYKIRRSHELQASQVLTTGKISLTDKNGEVMYVADFKPKTSHFFNANTAWNAGGCDILGDIETACDLIVDDGQGEPTMMIMGDVSFNTFIKDSDVQALFDNRRIDQGAISGMTPIGKGGKLRGNIKVGSYSLDIYTYNGRYKNPQTGAKTRYMPSDKVVIIPGDIRLDATFGSVPRFDLPAGTVAALPFMPKKFNSPSSAMGIGVFAYFTTNFKSMIVEVDCRAAYIPTAIDQIVCIDTGV